MSAPDKNASEGGGKKAQGSPTKDFFIRMITKDISLADCIMDLVDNAIDGARRTAKRDANAKQLPELNGFQVALKLDADRIEIDDNCGGISLDDAVNYAFHFGRRKDAPDDVDHAIGLYGIGMKRAIFKMGRLATIESWPQGEAFEVKVDVDMWEKNDRDWDFDIESLPKEERRGTRITISKPYDPISSAFSNAAFATTLIRTMARDYAFVLNKGFRISVNGVTVPQYDYKLKEGDDVAPAVLEYLDNEVNVRIVAGIMKELDTEIPEELRPDKTEPFGWYVVCNDRVVLAGNKTNLTVWANDGFPDWHPQYNGFAGFLFLSSNDPKRLPWTTTKREVDVGDPLYLRALTKMKESTKQFITYTNQRKFDPDAAKAAEMAAIAISVSSVPSADRPMKLPHVGDKAVGTDFVTISYRKPKAEVKDAAAELGDRFMSAREVGARTFDYFMKMEIGKS